MLVILLFEWSYEKTFRGVGERVTEWVDTISPKEGLLICVGILVVLLIVYLQFFTKKEESMFVPPVEPPIPEPIVPDPPEPEPETIEETNEPEDEYDQVERQLEIDALARLKKNIEETKEAVEQEGKRQDLKNREEMVKRKEKDIEMKTRFGL